MLLECVLWGLRDLGFDVLVEVVRIVLEVLLAVPRLPWLVML